jgi:Lipoate-protein ligase B
VNGELVFARAGFGASAVPYLDGWDLQRGLHERRVGGNIPDTCLMLEHQPVYTPAGGPARPTARSPTRASR